MLVHNVNKYQSPYGSFCTPEGGLQQFLNVAALDKESAAFKYPQNLFQKFLEPKIKAGI